MKILLLCLVAVILFVRSAFGGAVGDLLGEMITALSSCKTANQAMTIASRIMTSDRIKLAINSGDDINAKGEYGLTLLMLAAGVSNNPEIVRLLLEAGADVNARNNDGITALDYALENPNPEIRKIFTDILRKE